MVCWWWWIWRWWGGNEQPATLVPRPRLDPSCSTLLGRTAIAGKWGDKGYWSKRFGVSVSKGTSKALKYKALFELQFQLLEHYMQMLTSAMTAEGYAHVKEGFEREARERAQAFEKLTNAQDRTNQSVDQLRSEIGRVSGAVAAMDATLDQRFDELFVEVGTRAFVRTTTDTISPVSSALPYVYIPR